MATKISQSVERLVTDWMVWSSNPASCTMGTRSFPEVKGPELVLIVHLLISGCEWVVSAPPHLSVFIDM